METPRSADAVVVGGGIIGLAIARELAQRGLETVVVERHTPADRPTSATGASAGMVNPCASPHPEPEPLRDLSLLSRRLYGPWVEALEEESGLVCEYDERGGLVVARSEAEEVELDRALDWLREKGLPVSVLSREETLAKEPSLGPAVRAGFYFPDEAQVSPPHLGRALALAAGVAGARVLSQMPVTCVVTEAGRVTGVEIGDGRIATGVVVNACGAWAGHLPGVPKAPVFPVRGQIASVDASQDADRLRRLVFAPDVYLVPRRDGSVVIGSTVERAGFDARPTAAGIAGLLRKAADLVPALADYPVLATWAGLRPGSPDDLPLLGATSVDGYFLATGHFRNGLLLAPATASVLADVICEQSPPLSLAAFSPARFDV